MKFSIIVVCLNAGEKLTETVKSILRQSIQDYEIIIKDGGSKDGSIDKVKNMLSTKEALRVRFFVEKDKSIYDAMNQAVKKAKGDYYLFLNCGDFFFDETVLERTAKFIEKHDKESKLFYGDTFYQKTKTTVLAPKEITGFTCYRNIPCHQSCFYQAALFEQKEYECDYKIRADYDHFLWCFYQADANPCYLEFTVSSYEGGGYSESRENEKRDKLEHKEITEKYMSRTELLRYRSFMIITLQPLRKKIAENPALSGIYEKIKGMLR